MERVNDLVRRHRRRIATLACFTPSTIRWHAAFDPRQRGSQSARHPAELRRLVWCAAIRGLTLLAPGDLRLLL